MSEKFKIKPMKAKRQEKHGLRRNNINEKIELERSRAREVVFVEKRRSDKAVNRIKGDADLTRNSARLEHKFRSDIAS